jgi:hypothetical protein
MGRLKHETVVQNKEYVTNNARRMQDSLVRRCIQREGEQCATLRWEGGGEEGVVVVVDMLVLAMLMMIKTEFNGSRS